MSPKLYDYRMIDHYTIKPAPAVRHKDIIKKLSEGKLVPDLAKLSKVKAKLELIGDYEDMEKLRNLLKELAKV
jgi:hypothetical protein